jgi:hypothetical protein
MWHIAEINIARARAPLDHPVMASFVAQLEEVNRLADESPGFVWRLKSPDGGASSYVRIEDDERLIVNMSVWTIDEGFERLDLLTQSGPTPRAFTFKRRFPPPELP